MSDLREALRRSGKHRTHGMSKSTSYVTWAQMRQRCYNPKNTHFSSYGGRGITVCERWRNSFENFLADMGERPAGLELDRFPDTNGNYEPGNCRWTTCKENQRNRRSNVMLTFRGETLCISAWAERTGLPRKTLEKRLNRYGFSVEQALTQPVRRKAVSQ